MDNLYTMLLMVYLGIGIVTASMLMNAEDKPSVRFVKGVLVAVAWPVVMAVITLRRIDDGL